MWAWNSLQASLFELFNSLAGNAKTNHAIWHIFQSDKNQRELILSVASAILPTKSLRMRQIKWLISSTNTIAPFRNAVVHTPLLFQYVREGEPSAIIFNRGPARKQMLQRLELAGSGNSFWTAIAGDLFVLSQFASAMVWASQPRPLGAEPRPSPHRPRLLSLRRIAEIDRQMSPPQGRKGRKRRRYASRA